MLKKTLVILAIGFIAWLNLVLNDFREPLYYPILFCSLFGSYHLLKGLVSNPR